MGVTPKAIRQLLEELGSQSAKCSSLFSTKRFASVQEGARLDTV